MGAFTFVFRLFFWTFTGVMPVGLVMATLLYGVPTGSELAIVLGVLVGACRGYDQSIVVDL